MYKCSFAGASECGAFRDVVDCSQKLVNCKDDISHHLQSCHLSKLVGKIQENELILARAGMFYVPTTKQEDMWVCPKHRYNLGRNWRPLKRANSQRIQDKRRSIKTKMLLTWKCQKVSKYNLELRFQLDQVLKTRLPK